MCDFGDDIFLGDKKDKLMKLKPSHNEDTSCCDIDFENPQPVAYFKQQMKHFFDKGVDFLKLDKTDALPVLMSRVALTSGESLSSKILPQQTLPLGTT